METGKASTETLQYAPGRWADLYRAHPPGDDAQPPVLIWHGKQTDARATVTALAQKVAGRGFAVVAPDWNSDAPDGGRSDLLESVRFTRRRYGSDELLLVGWSLGGAAAAGLTLTAAEHAAEHYVRPVATVCLAGAFMVPDPITGRPPNRLPGLLRDGGHRTPFLLLHGAADDVVPIAASRDFAEILRSHGWPAEVAELDTDHAAIAGAGYDPAADRYLPGTDARTHAVADEVAAHIAAMAGRPTDCG